MAEEIWPDLPYNAWKETYQTLHMWTQVVGKIAVRNGPPLNHSWGSAFRVTPRGLATRTLYDGVRTFAFEFDFIDERLNLQTSEARTATVPLKAMPVADFYAAVMAMCQRADLDVKIWTEPVEIPPPRIRFERDTVHHSYDGAWAEVFWRILTQVDRVLNLHRGTFIGKSSPVHFFWGSFDLAVTRFSGKAAPPRSDPEAFMRDAYSHEVISHGFWPGSGPILEPSFYAYAAPSPGGLADAAVRPAAA